MYSQGTLTTKICGIEVDEKGITSMYNLKVMSRDYTTKFLEEWYKLIDMGVLPNPKQDSIGN